MFFKTYFHFVILLNEKKRELKSYYCFNFIEYFAPIKLRWATWTKKHHNFCQASEYYCEINSHL